MKHLFVLSALFLMLGTGLSAQIIKTKKVNVTSTPINKVAVGKQDNLSKVNTSRTKLVRIKMNVPIANVKSVRRKK